MSDWNVFVREARAGNFRGNRSLAMRSLSSGAGSKQRRQKSGRRIDFKNTLACWSRHCEVSVVESAGGEYGIPLVVSNIIYKLLGKKTANCR